MESITGLIYDPFTLLHSCGRDHPERPQRVSNTISHLSSKNLLTHPHISFVQKIDPAPEDIIKTCHSEDYINHIHNMWPKDLEKSHVLVLDTYSNEHTSKASDLAVGGVVTAIDKIMDGEWSNGFAIVRPPGHHSGFRNVVNGFCIYNNVAIGAKYLKKKYGLKRVLIFDWDIHHGDGTQHIFKQDEQILFISLHRYDRSYFYPGKSGDLLNSGVGKAEGFQMNIPWDTLNQDFEYPGDNEYIYVYERLLEPVIKEFKPEFVLISAGFDSARGDPLGQLQVSPDCYYYLTKKLLSICPKLLVGLEGGYNLDSIANSVEAVVIALLNQPLKSPESQYTAQQLRQKCYLPEYYHSNIDIMVTHFAKYWPILNHQDLKQYESLIKTNKGRAFGIYLDQKVLLLDSAHEKTTLQIIDVQEIKEEESEN